MVIHRTSTQNRTTLTYLHELKGSTGLDNQKPQTHLTSFSAKNLNLTQRGKIEIDQFWCVNDWHHMLYNAIQNLHSEPTYLRINNVSNFFSFSVFFLENMCN